MPILCTYALQGEDCPVVVLPVLNLPYLSEFDDDDPRAFLSLSGDAGQDEGEVYGVEVDDEEGGD